MGKTYRQCVVGVFINKNQKVLIAKRNDLKDAWQFPQGGIDLGETAQQALKREMWEELGVEDFIILKESENQHTYKYPDHLNSKISQKYLGQTQTWFLCRIDDSVSIDLSNAIDKEFDEIKWVDVEVAVHRIVGWKKETYKNALKELGFNL